LAAGGAQAAMSAMIAALSVHPTDSARPPREICRRFAYFRVNTRGAFAWICGLLRKYAGIARAHSSANREIGAELSWWAGSKRRGSATSAGKFGGKVARAGEEIVGEAL